MALADVGQLLRFAAVAIALLGACSATIGAVGEDGAHYKFKLPSRDGIGKIYMGREISHVMGHLGAGWLERPERLLEERTGLLIPALALQEDDVVVDLGAGTGYFSTYGGHRRRARR
jgi:hypothetical protein